MSRPASLLIAAVVAALLAGGYALGASTSSTSTIRACANKKSGALRLAGKKGRCPRHYRKLSWSVTGPRGSAGVPGTAGSNGSPGTAGTPGGVGPQGPGAIGINVVEPAGTSNFPVAKVGDFTVVGSCLA